MNIDKNILIMLWAELTPLLCLKWFEPVGSRLELLLENIKEESSEGITKEDISLLRKMKINVSNLPNDVKVFLSAIGCYLIKENGNMEIIDRSKSAIYSLGWSASMQYRISEHYSEILTELWIEIYGYDCPFDFA